MADTLVPIKQYVDTAANLASANPTPLVRQIIYESDTGRTKIGDGTTAYNSLPYAKLHYNTYALDSETLQTTTFTAAKFVINTVDCSGGAVTVNPPSSPVVNDRFAVVDATASAKINNITVDFVTATQKFYGSSSNNYVINANGGFVEFVYIGSTTGWISSK